MQKRSIWVKVNDLFCPCDLKIWQMTLKNNRAPLLYCVKLCASFQSNKWIQTGVIVQKRSIWGKIRDFFVPCDLPIRWRTFIKHRALLSMVITPEHFMMIRWWEHIEKGVTDGQTNKRKEVFWEQLNKANLRDLRAATGLVILLKILFKSFCPWKLEIW